MLYVSCATIEADIEEIRKHLDSMQEAFATKDMTKVASFYTDDSYLIGPDGILSQGRMEVDQYWKRIKNPISWRLEDFGTWDSLNGLVNSKVFHTTQFKPPLWDKFNVELKSENSLYYQLGRSTLVRQNGGVDFESVVNFILVWEKIADGQYKILMDSYIRASAQ